MNNGRGSDRSRSPHEFTPFSGEGHRLTAPMDSTENQSHALADSSSGGPDWSSTSPEPRDGGLATQADTQDFCETQDFCDTTPGAPLTDMTLPTLMSGRDSETQDFCEKTPAENRQDDVGDNVGDDAGADDPDYRTPRVINESKYRLIDFLPDSAHDVFDEHSVAYHFVQNQSMDEHALLFCAQSLARQALNQVSALTDGPRPNNLSQAIAIGLKAESINNRQARFLQRLNKLANTAKHEGGH